ncbi:hypothetical protein IPJ72_03980 [Candidatus Peregrinibacteria bacterium]|nr:MAG: hypothetical protein IPJ72_03980 [Candidatus Peregrinibacteria bacterium]
MRPVPLTDDQPDGFNFGPPVARADCTWTREFHFQFLPASTVDLSTYLERDGVEVEQFGWSMIRYQSEPNCPTPSYLVRDVENYYQIEPICDALSALPPSSLDSVLEEMKRL